MKHMAALMAGLLMGVTAQYAFGQSACETNCNQVASDCMKRCAGDTKEAAKQENAPKLMACLKGCKAKTEPCRDACGK